MNGSTPSLDIINSLRDRFAGNREGFLELSRTLARRETELTDKILAQTKNDNG